MTLTDSTMLNMRSDLVAGVADANRRRRSRRRIATAVPAVALVAGAAMLLADDNKQPAYALTQAADGTIRVEVYPGFDDVDDLQQSLADVGLQTVVIHLKGHPSLDGVIEVSSHNNEGSGAVEFDDGEFVIEPSQVEGEIEILIYSAAAEGENYQFAPSIFAPGQPLGGLPCAYPDEPLTTAELERRATEAGITNIDWVLFENAEPGETGVEDLEQRPEAIVSGAQLRNVDTLRVIAVPDLTEPAADTLSMSDGTHYRQTPGCTPELASLWD